MSAHEGPGFGSRPWQPTFAPAFARATAIAAPSPRCDPVTRAVLPFNWKASRLIDSLLPDSRGNEDCLLVSSFQSRPATLKPRLNIHDAKLPVLDLAMRRHRPKECDSVARH